MAKYNQHVRLPLELFNHPGYLGLAEEHKAKCLAILVILIRFANPKSGQCYPRYSKFREMIGLSRMTLYRCISLLIAARLIIKKRLSSTNLYTLAPILLVNHVSVRYDDVSDRYLSDTTLISINKNNINKVLLINNRMKDKIDSIVNNTSLTKQNKIIELASVPLAELKECIKYHPYYVQKAIEHQEQELREQKILPKHIIDQTITAAVSKSVKNRSAAYKAKVEYNKRNNLNWKGEPIVKK